MKKYLYLVLLAISFALNASQECKEDISKGEVKAWQQKLELGKAMMKGRLSKIEELLNSGVDTKSVFEYLLNFMQIKRVSIELAEKIGELFIKHNIDIDQIFLGSTVFDKAINMSELEAVKLLIKLGADINKQDLDGNTVLIELSGELGYEFEDENSITQNFKRRMLFLLLLNGANLTIANNDNETFFDYLQENVEVQNVVNEFIDYILDAEGVNDIKGAENALLIAAYLKEPNLVNALLRKGLWFKSQENHYYFNNLIADQPDIQALVNQYKLEHHYLITNTLLDNTELVPDLINVVHEY
ncbi:MAG: ankyrin repeat domain-containing protein [Candidatus Babeliales bacterium]|nr:ankyrin repeat domain-containing protein [Candidatus Babeliales bacterium]